MPINTELRRSKPNLTTILGYIGLSIAAVLVMFPFAWMLSASFKPDNDVYEFPIRWIPKIFRWQNYVDIWKQIKFGVFYFNTVKLTVIITFLQLLTSSLAAYAFAKIKFKGRNTLFIAYIGTIAVPFQVYMIPQFIIIRKLGLSDSHLSLILIQAFTAYGVFLLRQFFMSIPEELSESARIDGLGELGIYAKIILPLAKPALTSLGIFTAVFVWNDFLGPLIYLTSQKNLTIQLGIRLFLSDYNQSFALIMAAAVCSMIPVVLIFLIAQRFLIEGIATTGIKG
ncbi:carbohydrate ABC transporter permease [Ruminiclostridium cellobioparum]|uniref:ABC-type sugar transport system, permease component n=1 Tax=Ruminiclostridium cellobioparum subsp. termitidis CT1112 TaxID=1195236 RepID=S0FUN6_RUMCE|nr:carbohydrate ABC transporter permease [Ruminiclostridium cellobioparum]EMS72849.1 ABC-type sugar transport system, permease component [Ruminiclostridium cellobioparum subsp. termitidis CT1112]